jgi:hypothetical protein
MSRLNVNVSCKHKKKVLYLRTMENENPINDTQVEIFFANRKILLLN